MNVCVGTCSKVLRKDNSQLLITDFMRVKIRHEAPDVT